MAHLLAIGITARISPISSSGRYLGHSSATVVLAIAADYESSTAALPWHLVVQSS